MRIFASIGSLAVGAAITLGAGTGLAAEETPKDYSPCSRKPTAAETSAAKGAFQAGQAAFNEADYGRAITYWEDAFHRDCTASPLLLNLARAYELDGQKRHAALALQTFLDRNPGSSEEGQIKRRIDKLNEQIAAEASSQTSSTASGSGTTASAETASTQPAEPSPTAPPPPAPAEDTGSKARSPVPLIVAGAGGALAIIGGIVYFTAQSKISDVEKQCGGSRTGCTASLADEGNSARTRATIGGAVGIVGLAAAAGGVVWYFVQSPAKSSTAQAPRTFRAGISPDVGWGYSGVSVVGQF